MAHIRARYTSNVRRLLASPKLFRLTSKTHSLGRSSLPTAASFLRPNQAWDAPRSFTQALREKYMPSESHATTAEAVYISGKQAEEVGFSKFAARQAQLQGIHTVVVDNMRIRYDPNDTDNGQISKLCAQVTELDLSSNLFETLEEVLGLCRHFLKLHTLALNGNRFSSLTDVEQSVPLSNVQSLRLDRTLLPWSVICSLTRHCFPKTRTLLCANNDLSLITATPPDTLDDIDLSFNSFSDLGHALFHTAVRCLKRVNLKYNNISAFDVGLLEDSSSIDCRVESLNLSYNAITSFSIFDALNTKLSHTLRHLQVTGNPLYQDLKSAEGKSLTSEDGYMLTIARLPHLETLNYSKITEKEKVNADTYYLNQIAAELSRESQNARREILQRHPRWEELCLEYGEPAIMSKPEAGTLNPNSLATRLVSITLARDSKLWTDEVPKSFNIYALLGLVGKKVGVAPLKLHLIWETGERDPIGRDGGYEGPEWWESDEDEETVGLNAATDEARWVMREVELVAGTRALGTYIEGREARVRVEMR